MPKLDKEAYDAAEVSSGGEFKRICAGAYVCRIQAVRTSTTDYGRTVDFVKEKQYVKLLWTPIEGEFAGYFDDDYYADKDYAHTFYLSWKNYGALKGVCQAFDESNPGFDAYAAINADAWDMFVGKKVGIVVGEEEYVGNDGSVRTRLGFPRVKSVQDVRDGRYKVPELKKLPEQQQAAARQYDDVPF